MFFTLAHNLGAKRSSSALTQVLVVVLLNINRLRNLLNLSHRDLTSLLKPVRNLKRVDTFIQQFLRLF